MRKTHIVRKKVTIKVQEGLMRLPMTVIPHRVKTMIQRLSYTMKIVGQRMKKRIVMKMKMYQEVIKTLLTLPKHRMTVLRVLKIMMA